MKTAEEILFEHLEGGCLEREELEERKDEPWVTESIAAMEVYRDQELKHVVDCNISLTLRLNGLLHETSQLRADKQTLEEENTSLRSYIQDLEDTLGLRNRSNPDLTIDDEPKSLFDKWKECKD